MENKDKLILPKSDDFKCRETVVGSSLAGLKAPCHILSISFLSRRLNQYPNKESSILGY